MHHLPPMIFDLAIILGAAAVSTLIFSKLRQPVVLGYLIAGFAVGPYFPLWPTVVDKTGVSLWAEIGVIFLLFGLGLEFSFKKLAKVGKSAFIAAIFEIITMSSVGYLVGRALGWTSMDSIYLGAILSMSSTTIIIRAFDEAGLKGKVFASLVFGILIVEDLMAILLMVILSALSVPGSFSGSNIAFLSGRLVFFLLIWFLIGIYVLPSLLTRVRKLLSNEIMLIVSISLCFLMVVLATKADFSAALGAFIMGSILAETQEGERIEHLMASVKDLFAAVFFVSVGMMIDPNILQEHFWVVILITAITIVGKLLGSGFGAVLSGRSLKHSTQAGMSLAQIGEFSFIIASLGVSLKVVSDFLYPIIIAVSAVTTFTTPYMIKYSGPIYSWMEARLPSRFINLLGQYEKGMASNGQERALGLIWKTYGPLILLNSVVVLAIGFASAKFVLPIIYTTFGNDRPIRAIACVITLAACSPFLYGTVLKVPKVQFHEPTALLRLSRLQFGVVIFRAIVGLVIIEVVINQFATTKLLPLIVLASTPILVIFFRKYVSRFYARVENQFLQNLNAKELAEVESLNRIPQLAPWNASLAQMELSSDSSIVGQTLEESKFRSTTGATIAMIDRGRRRIFAPSRAERLFPYDELFLIGTEEQLAAAQKLIQSDDSAIDPPDHDELYNLESFFIEPQSRYANKTIREIGVGAEFDGLIVGVESAGSRILNPESTVVLHPGDVVWVFGHKKKIRDIAAAARSN